MAQTYTLDEAAEKLGITTQELKRRLREDWKTLKSFRDGSTLRFRANDIEELARSMGAASEPDLPLAAINEGVPAVSDDFKLHGPDDGTPVDEPLVFGSSDDDIFSLSLDEPTPLAPQPKKNDSDVRLEPKGKAHDQPDSDVRLEAAPKKSGMDSAIVPTEELSLDLGGPGSAIIKGGSSAKLPPPKSSGKVRGTDSQKPLSSEPDSGDSSEFELSLDADSDDFELQLNTDSSDEVDLGAMPPHAPGKARSNESGINLRDPADSGISLEKRGKPRSKQPPAEEDDSDDFELSLDPGSSSGIQSSGPPSGRLSRPEPVTSDSDSEFELTLDDDSGGTSSLEHAALDDEEGDKGDIFETDFEIPPMSDDSGSEAVELDSDTDLEASDELALDDSDVISDDDESASEVVMLDDEEAADVDLSDPGMDVVVEDDDPDSIGSALVGVKGRSRDDDDDDDEPVVAGVAPAAPWGPLPALFLFPAFVLVIMGGLVGFELMHTMWGYQQPKQPSTPIVRGIAKSLEMDIKQ